MARSRSFGRSPRPSRPPSHRRYATLPRRKSRLREMPRVYTTRLQKGGALLAEMRRLTLEWDGTPDCTDRLLQTNALSAPSRARLRDVITRTFVPRFVESRPPDLWRAAAILERAGWRPESLAPIHYYAAAASETLLWDFVLEVLDGRPGWAGREVRTADVLRFLEALPDSRFPAGRWSKTVRTKVARGLLAALRDFGVLAGAVKKRITTLYLPVESFACIARIRHELGVRGHMALRDPCWRLFFLGESAVERLFLEAHQQKLLSYLAAGSVIRIDFPGATLEEYARELAQRAR